jgi:phosphatidylinositol alpha-1,6-mannosyltransferase
MMGRRAFGDMTGGLRIAMLLGDAFGGFGGIAKFNRDFLTALIESNRVAHVRALPRTISEPIEPAIPPSITYESAAAAGKWAYARRVLASLLRRDRIDVVICGHRNLLPVAWTLARLRGAYLVLIVHGFEAWKPSASRVLNWLSGRIDALVSVSHVTADRYCAWTGFPVERAFILANCVDLERFTPKTKDAVLLRRHGLAGARIIMTLGRIVENERYKGIDEVIDVVPRLLRRWPDLKYMVVGDGSDRPRLEAKAATMGLADHVIFTGRITEADKVAYYNLADAYVMPSSGEGFGIVLIEALACGLPVVGSSVDGSRDALLGGELGRLADPADSDAVFNAIVAALEDRRDERSNRLDLYSERTFKSRVAAWVEQIGHTLDHRLSPASHSDRAWPSCRS